MSKIRIDKAVELYITDWINQLQKQSAYSENTLNAYITDLFYFFKFVSNHYESSISKALLEQLTAQDFRAWLAFKKRKSLKSTSIARALSVVRNFYKYLEDNHQIINSAIWTVKAAKIPKSLPRALPCSAAIEATKVISHIASDTWVGARDSAILLLLYGCGLRIGEVLSIKKSDLPQLGSNIIIIRGKGRKERSIPLLPKVREALNKYLEECPYSVEDGPLFCGIRGGPLNPDVFRHTLKKLKKSLGLPSYTSPHAFRHSFATHLLQEGVDLRTIQELLGHKSLSTTQKYTKIDGVGLLSAYSKYHPRNKKNDKN